MIVQQAWPLWLDTGDGEPRPIIAWDVDDETLAVRAPITARAPVLTTGERLMRRVRERTGRGEF